MINLHTILGCWMLAVCFCNATGTFRWVLTAEKLEGNYVHSVPYQTCTLHFLARETNFWNKSFLKSIEVKLFKLLMTNTGGILCENGQQRGRKTSLLLVELWTALGLQVPQVS